MYHLDNACISVVRFRALVLFPILFSLISPWYSSDAIATMTQPPPGELLQFAAGGHVLGFLREGVYIAGKDHVLNVTFENTQGVEPVAGNTSLGHGKVQQLTSVSYPELWPGISLKYDAVDGSIVESTWNVAPGADPNLIRLKYNAPVQIEHNGGLKISYATGWAQESRPVAWQEINGRRIPVQVAFRTLKSGNAHEIGFKLGQYNPSHPLVIDPVLTWVTFLGVTAFPSRDEGYAIAIDGSGNTYVVGTSDASWGSPVNPYVAMDDVFVAKLDAGGVVQWNTFLGGDYSDYGKSIALDKDGNIYLTGSSWKTWGTPIIPFSGTQGNSEPFAAKLNANGALQWNTFMGSTSSDDAYDIVVDASGNSYVTGNSYLTSWGSPVTPHAGQQDAWVLKLNTNGARVWNTFIGGSGYDFAEGIVQDGTGNIYITGNSDTNFGSPVNVHSPGSNRDIFIAKLSGSGAYQWHTFLGTSENDVGSAIAIDSSDKVYVSGVSEENWGTPVVGHTAGLNEDAFVVKLSSSGTVQWNTFLGSSSGGDNGPGLALDNADNIYVAGGSSASWGTPLDPYGGNNDAYAAKLNPDGTLAWNTFVGTTAPESQYAKGIVLDSRQRVYVVGTHSVPDPSYNYDVDVFVAGIDPFFTVTVSPVSPSIRIAAGDDHSLALKNDGTISAWGNDAYNQTTDAAGVTNARAVAAGGMFSLALLNDGTISAWGNNTQNQTTIPAEATGIVAIASGYEHALALKDDNTVIAWGRNDVGQATIPSGLKDVAAIAAGDFHSLALKYDGTVVAWGWDTASQSTVPVGLTDVVAIAAGYNHSLALKNDGTVVAWGDDTYGESTVPSLSKVVAIAAGDYFSLALQADGTVVHWGLNTLSQMTVPADLKNVIAITSGKTHALALKNDGTVVAWGSNDFGETTVPTPLDLSPVVGTNGSIVPGAPRRIAVGSTAQFTILPMNGYAARVEGTCGGSLAGNTFTTDAVTVDCTVDAQFVPSGSKFYIIPFNNGKAVIFNL
jgi:alpha-tubulin suppressor-like RCC1 family protein